MTDIPQPGIRKLLSPRYWPSWIGFGLLRLIALLPYPAGLVVGRMLGQLLHLLPLPTRQIARINIDLCFPELPEKERTRILRDHFISLGISLVETAYSWWGTGKKVMNRYRIEGLEHLQEAKSKGNGVILLNAHFTTLELGGCLIGKHTRLAAMYRDQKNLLADRIMFQGRSKNADIVIHRNDIRSLLKALKDDYAVWYAPDQNYAGSNHAFVPFFGIPAATNTATARIAKTSGAAVVPFLQYRDDNNNYHLVIEPALKDFPGDDLVAATARINQVIEAQIRQAPAQYLWVHRRFKNRPEGVDPVYPGQKT